MFIFSGCNIPRLIVRTSLTKIGCLEYLALTEQYGPGSTNTAILSLLLFYYLCRSFKWIKSSLLTSTIYIFRDVCLPPSCGDPVQPGGHLHLPVHPGRFHVHPLPPRRLQVPRRYDRTHPAAAEGKKPSCWSSSFVSFF